MTRALLVLCVLCVPALARDNGQYTNVSSEVREWFRTQKSPKTGGLCCNEADGTYAEEDIRNGVIARDRHEPFRAGHGERQVQLHHRFETAVRQRVHGF
jgi:hypothetical protein